MGEQKPKNSAKDLVWGILLVVFGIYVVIASAGMKATSQKTFLDSPGFFPLIVGAILAVFGAILAFIAVKCGGVGELKEALSGTFLKKFIKSESTVRVLVLLAMMIIYMYILMPAKWISFVPATALYLTATFHYLRALNIKNNKMLSRIIEIVVAVGATFIIYYAFILAFNITMP